jgi:ribosome maturation factor RimP
VADVALISGVLEPVVRALGLSLYDVEISGSGRARVVRVLVDRPDGVDLDAVAAAADAISPVLDAPPVDGWLTGPYALEVSSPGLERPLRTPAHFRGAEGETVSVKTRAGSAPARRDRGVVQRSDEHGFELLLDDGTVLAVSYDEVVQARTVFEWASTPKRSRAPKRGESSPQLEEVVQP